jgi:hypothetical protein
MTGLENRLVEKKMVTGEQFTHAREEALKRGRSVWSGLVMLGYLSEADISRFFAGESGVPYVDISAYRINRETLVLLDKDYCVQNSVMPLFRVKNRLFVACGNPFNTGVIEALEKMSGLVVAPLICDARSIQAALDIYWGMDDKFFEAGNFILGPKRLRKISLWRESERLTLTIPVAVNPKDSSVLVCSGAPIAGKTCNISAKGNAAAINIPLFLPEGLKVLMDFSAEQPLSDLKVSGEIVHSYMDNARQYTLGVKFTDIKDVVKNKLLQIAKEDKRKPN